MKETVGYRPRPPIKPNPPRPELDKVEAWLGFLLIFSVIVVYPMLRTFDIVTAKESMGFSLGSFVVWLVSVFIWSRLKRF